MKRFLGALLLAPLLALAQVGNFPALIGQKGATTPTNCAIGQLFFDTDATAGQNVYGCTAANTWTLQGDGGPAIGSTVSSGTAGSVLFVATGPVLAQDNANFKWGTTAGQGLTLGAGTAASAVNALNITQTWNFNTTPITMILANATNTSSHASTLLMDLQVGGVTKFNVAGSGAGTTATITAASTDAVIKVITGSGVAGAFLNSANNDQSWLTGVAGDQADAWIVYDNTGATIKLLQSKTAGAGLAVTAGTATTDVAALSVTRTNNNAAVATGVQIAFTDTSSAVGFLPFQVLGGASATTNLFSVSKGGTISASTGSFSASVAVSTFLQAGQGIYDFANGSIGLVSGSSSDVNINRITAGIYGIGNGTAGSIAGGIQLASIGLRTGIIADSATAPSIASGGCTSPTVTNNNGTARMQIDVGTSCSGSQPIVLTLPATTVGWACTGRNISNPASSVPSSSGAVSTTSATITNYARTTGLAAAWTDGDDIEITCRGG